MQMSYKGRVPRIAQKKDYHFAYLIDMQSMFHPALCNGCLLQQIIFSFEDATREEKERHFALLKGFIWNTILGLAERVAFKLLKAEEGNNINEQDRQAIVPQAKKNSASTIQHLLCWKHW